MLDNFRSLAKNSIIYSFGNLSIKLTGLILLPIYTDYLSLYEYGIFSILDTTLQILVIICGLNLYAGFFRWYYDEATKGKQNKLFFTTFISISFLCLSIYLLSIPFFKSLSNLLCDTASYTTTFHYIFITMGLQAISMLPSSLMRLQEKSGLFTIAQLIRLVVTLVFTIVFIMHFKKGIDGIFEAQVIGFISYFAFLSFYIYKNSSLGFEFKLLKSILKYSYPLTLSALSSVFLTFSDKYILKFIIGLTDVGFYSLGSKIANTINIFIAASINMAVVPMVFKLMDKANNKKFYSKIMTFNSFIVMYSVVALSILNYELVRLFTTDPSYWDTYKIIPFLAIAIMFQFMKDTSLNGLNIAKKTGIIALITILISTLNIGLNLLFIPTYKSMGAAYATLASQILFFLTTLIFAQKKYYIPYEFKKLFILILIGVSMIYLGNLIHHLNLVVRLFLKAVILICFPIILFVFKYFDEKETTLMINFWNKWKNIKSWRNNMKQ